MAKRQNHPAPNPDISKQPLWETYAKKPLPGGRVMGVDGSMWLYRTVQMGPVLDAKDSAEALTSGSSLMSAMRELSEMAVARGLNRRMVQHSYREIHLVMSNFPRWFHATQGGHLGDYQNRVFRNASVLDRRLMLGVRLVPTAGEGGVRKALESIQHTLISGGTLASDFDRDYELVSAALARAGLGIPTPADFKAADAWWNYGKAADTPTLTHGEHLHFFRSTDAVRNAEREGLEDCEPWLDIRDHMAVTFASVADFELGYTSVEDSSSWWASHLSEAGARVVSIRGKVEPPAITRQELKAQRRKVRSDLQEAATKGKHDQAAAEQKEAELDDIERAYDANKDAMPPTLVDASIIVGFAGVHDEVERLVPATVDIRPMLGRQAAAWHETLICSNVRANPHLHDLPATTIAYSGLTQLSVVGDDEGALVGFTERDRQPVYLSPTAASAGDSAPTLLIGAGTGSGKTLLLQWIAHQHALMGRPSVIIDPKPGSDLTPVAALTGGKVVSLDDFILSDGGLDPLSLFDDPAQGIPLAASMLFRTNPWGDERRRTFEADIAGALQYGVQNGATATGQALRIAYDAGVISGDIVADVFKVAETYPMFRATCGMNPASGGLAVSNGITLFKVGKANLILPPVNAMFDERDMDASMRHSVNLLRMLVRGSMTALTGRGGVLHMDEAWVLERAAPDELNEVGRLARSQNVLPILYTQTPSGPLRMGMKGYISRGLIGHTSAEDEALAGLDLFRAASDQNIGRVVAPENVSGAANWNSLKALRDPSTREVKRGAVFFYADLKQRFAPVEVSLPAEFLELASTNPEDVARRLAAEQ